MESIVYFLHITIIGAIGMCLFYLIRTYIKFEYENYVQCDKVVSSYRYKLTKKNLLALKNTIADLLSYENVLVPIKISSVSFDGVVRNLKYPIIFSHHSELNSEYIKTHYPYIYNSRCFATIDSCKIVKNSMWSVLYEYKNGCLTFTDYIGDIDEIDRFCTELRNIKSRIYRMVKLDECQLEDKCPFLYIDVLNKNKYSIIQKHSDCHKWNLFEKSLFKLRKEEKK